MTDDVVVVGGGIEGYVAALTAALEEPVADVRLLVQDDGRFCHEPGWIDLLGYPPADGDSAGDDGAGPVREPLQEPFAALADLPEDHPYSRAGIEEVRRALSLFEELSGYEGLDSDANALVATATGEVTPTFLYPDSVASGLASDGRETLLVGFERIVDFDAALAAAKLDEQLPYDVGHTTIELDVEVGGAEPAERFAEVLDDNEELDGELPARRAVAGKIRNDLDIEPRIGFPAVLGRSAADDVRSDLEAILQADVFEVPLGPPSMPGLRLADRLRSELDDAGVAVETGMTVTDVGTADDRIASVEVAGGSAEGDDLRERYEGEQFVLATGGLGAGGLRADRERIREPAFGCHVAQPADRADWVAEGFLDDQPFARAGLAVDDEFRPLDADGTPEFENLRAAGRVLGGADVAAEQSTGGVAVVTGYAAGQLAAEW
jgi:glycerol-3-phosphate dehydrogenase subunit B